MDSFNALITRSSSLISARDASSSLSPTMLNLIIALMVLIFIGLLVIIGLYTIRKVRKSRAARSQTLPQYNTSESSLSLAKNMPNHRRLTITATPYGGRPSSILVYDEKNAMSPSSPLSPDNVPEIRITFPDEHDEMTGRLKSGRVVVVKVGENGVGLEPLRNEQLPAYEKETGGRFDSIDMERIGGLKEKSSWS